VPLIDQIKYFYFLLFDDMSVRLYAYLPVRSIFWMIWFYIIVGVVSIGIGQQALSNRIERILREPSQEASIAFVLQDARDQSIIYEQNAPLMMVPASLQKLLTSYIALSRLGPDFTFKTHLYSDSEDHLILELSGDPHLSSIDLSKLFAMIGGQRKWKKLLIINPMRDFPDKNPSWMFEDVPSSYATAVAFAPIDQNFLSIQLSLNADQTIAVQTSCSYPLKVSIQYLPQGNYSKIDLFWEEGVLNLKGIWDGKASTSRYRIGVPQARLHFDRSLKQILDQHGLKVDVEHTLSKPNKKLHLLGTHTSARLLHSVSQALHISDNNYHDTLFLGLAFVQNKNIDSWLAAASSFKALAESIIPDLDWKYWAIDDGSGLSVKNNVNARTLMQLIGLHHQFVSWLSILPTQQNTHSTLGPHFSSLKGTLWAKTGRMQGVSNIAGYLKIKDHFWRFVFMINQGRLSRERSFELPRALFKTMEDYAASSS